MIKKIFMVHHTHMDIGYTDLASEVMDQHLNHLDMVLELCRANKDLPPEQHFYWTCESALLVKDYLDSRPEFKKKELLNALKKGWIELQAFLTQPLTEVASCEELIQCVSYAAQLGKSNEFIVESAMIDDIAGFTGRLSSILSGLDVRYLTAGAGAFQVFLPWAKEMPHLFYLQGKDNTKTLLWNLGINRNQTPQEAQNLDAVYGAGNTYIMRPYFEEFMKTAARGVEIDIDKENESICEGAYEKYLELEKRLLDENYPYEEVMIQYGGDNRGPDSNLVKLLERINKETALPNIQLTTPKHFFRLMEEKYGTNIPCFKGVITDPWNIRATPQPVALKRFRMAQRELKRAEAGFALQHLSWNEKDQKTFKDAYDKLLLFSDHTFGMSEWGWHKVFDKNMGCRDSCFDRYRKSWNTKLLYAEQALDLTRKLSRKARQISSSFIKRDSPSLLIFNNSTHKTEGLAEVYLGRDAFPIKKIVDTANSRTVEFQKIGHNNYLILSPEINGMGCKCLDVVFEEHWKTYSNSPTEVKKIIKNSYLKVQLNSLNGKIVSIKGKASGKEFLDQSSDTGFADFIYHTVDNLPFTPVQAGMVKDWQAVSQPVVFDEIKIGMNGALANSIVVHEHIDGPSGIIRIKREIILQANSPRIDVRLRIDKPETEKKETCHIAFPCAGKSGKFRFDQNLGTISPVDDLLPGAMQDLFYCNSWVSVWEENCGVVIACPDAPVFQFGAIRTGQWEDKLPFKSESNHLYGFIYHNLPNTDNPVWQDILEEFNFSVMFCEENKFSHNLVEQFATEAISLLKAEYHGLNTYAEEKEQQLDYMQIIPASARVVSIRRVSEDTTCLRIENTTGETLAMKLETGGEIIEVHKENLFGENVDKISLKEKHAFSVMLAPFELTTFCIRKKC